MPAKRPAPASKDAAKKAKVAEPLDPLDMKCETISIALRNGNLQGSLVDMLASGLPHAMRAPRDARHAYDEKFLEIYWKELSNVEEQMKATISANEEQAANVNEEGPRREAKVSSSKAHVEAMVTTLATCREELVRCSTTLATAKEELAAAKVAQEEANKNLDGLTDKKSVFTFGLEKIELVQKDEELNHSEEANAISSKLASLVTDASLLEAARVSLSKSPPQRGQFDAMVVKQLVDELTKELAAIEESLAAADQTKVAHEKTVLLAKETLDAANDKHMSAMMEESNASVASEEAQKAVIDAERSVANLQGDIAKAAETAEASRKLLTQLQEGPIATFRELRDGPLQTNTMEDTDSKAPEVNVTEENVQKIQEVENTCIPEPAILGS